jgi:hypothetical protein
MSDEFKPDSTWLHDWLALEDGIARPRPRMQAMAVTRTNEPERSEVLLEAARIFESLGAHIPKRVSDEELGDALEALHRMVKEGQPRWKLHARLLSTLFWASAHAVQDYLHHVAGAKTAALGSSRVEADR